ncbi:MAG TPA: hypothetical protein DCF63_08940 [Planctomycetaceae bacterium]|nr:hypothetical protein [Planctomycetaceae bacterium]
MKPMTPLQPDTQLRTLNRQKQTGKDRSQPIAGPHYPLCWSEQVGVQSLANHQRPDIQLQKNSISSVKPSLTPASVVPRPHLMPTNSNAQNNRWEASQAAGIANEIRVPLRLAASTVLAFAQQMQSNCHFTVEDALRLSIANANLQMVGRWMESLGLTRIGQHQLSGSGVTRCRFRLAEWRGAIARTLEELAAQQQVKLDWIGWDMALPDLYLDPARLSRLLFHLTIHAVAATEPGGKVVIRAGWKDRLSERIVIWVEYLGQGLSPELMRCINRVAPWQELPVGTSLNMAAKLIGEIGGSVSAQTGSRGGNSIGILLPVDQCNSLVRSWLTQNAISQTRPGQQYVNVYAVGCQAENAQTFNAALQSAATPKQFVYQVTTARWLVLEIKSASGSPESMLMVALQKTLGAMSHKLGKWQSQSVFRSSLFTFENLLTSEDADARLPQLASQIAKRMQQLIGDHELITQPITLDQLSQPNSQTHIPSTVFDNQTASKKKAAATNKEDAPGQQVVSDIVKQWKLVQSKLAQLHDQLDTSHERRIA